MSEPIAILMVHGIGATRRHAMMDGVTEQIKAQRPDWNIDEHYEVHEFSEFSEDASSDPNSPRPHIHIRKGTRPDGDIALADAYWGDISLVREGAANVVWGMLVNMFGIRYLSYVGLSSQRFFQFLVATFVFVIAAINLPLNLFAMLHALLVVHFQSHLLRGDLPNFEGSLRYLDFDGNLHLAAGASLLVASLIGVALALGIRYLSYAAWKERPLIGQINNGGLFLSLAMALIAFAFFLVPATLSNNQDWATAQRSITQFLKDDFIAGYGDLVRNKRWAVYRYVEIADDGQTTTGEKTARPACPDISTDLTSDIKQALSEYQMLAKCITPAGVYLSAIYVFQTIPLWFLVLVSAVILSYLIVLCAQRIVPKKPLAGILVSVGSLYTLWFVFGSLLLFVIPADIVTDFAIQRSLFPPTQIHAYRAYWFELSPAIAVLTSALITGLVFWTWRALATRRAAKLWGREGSSSKRWHPSDGANVSTKTLVKPRLVAPWLFLAGMFVYALVIHYFTTDVILKRLGISVSSPAGKDCGEVVRYFDALDVDKLCVPYQAFIPLDSVWLTLVVLTVIGSFVLIGSLFRTGLKAAMDVINHFTAPHLDFPVRKRIANRIRSSLTTLLDNASSNRSLKPHLVIFAHSQGTVIIADRILTGDLGVLLDENRVSKITIFTFGSPLTNVYQRYFPEAYPDMRDGSNDALMKLKNDNRVTWHNLYRIDDYVGTYIHGAEETFPKNHPLMIGGHTSYWTQDAFAVVGQICRAEHAF